jgi:hypothetical protein
MAAPKEAPVRIVAMMMVVLLLLAQNQRSKVNKLTRLKSKKN